MPAGEEMLTIQPERRSRIDGSTSWLRWNGAQTWGREVRLPDGFDLMLASIDGDARETLKPLSAWSQLGVIRADGRPLPKSDLAAALVLPAGAAGPAFLVYDNFRVILKWNRSIYYALAVGHLSDRIVGGGQLLGRRLDDPPLSREQVSALQAALQSFGFLATAPDGTLGSGTRRALRQYQLACDLPPDGYASQTMARKVLAAGHIGTPCAAPAPGVAFRDSRR